MKTIVAVIGIFLALAQAGCATSSDERCRQEGFRPGTDSFRLCRLTIEENRIR